VLGNVDYRSSMPLKPPMPALIEGRPVRQS
jgi:hypothetical protein